MQTTMLKLVCALMGVMGLGLGGWLPVHEVWGR